ncbi:50S ribosomal protein L10 [Ruminococcaceae bacterium OttesenSCG-928-I18]|nr:50S ribosomal protein L10 [Ruminococcaceae bacterium OttesenSCG-928-I18]
MPSATILEKKQEYVEHLRGKIEAAPAGVLVDYIGINVEQDTALRKELREAGVDYKVVKNTMLHLALQNTPYAELDSVLTGSTALALANEEDSLAAARILCKYAEKSKGKFTVKIGYMDGKVMPAEEVVALSKLPGREGLLSMLLSALTGNLRGLAVGLNALAEKRAEEGGEQPSQTEEKPAEAETKEAAEETPAEAKAEEPKADEKTEESAPAEEKAESSDAES